MITFNHFNIFAMSPEVTDARVLLILTAMRMRKEQSTGEFPAMHDAPMGECWDLGLPACIGLNGKPGSVQTPHTDPACVHDRQSSAVTTQTEVPLIAERQPCLPLPSFS